MAVEAIGGADPADSDIFRRLMPSDGSGPPDVPQPDLSQPGTGPGDNPAPNALVNISPSALRAAGAATARIGGATRGARSHLEHAHTGLAKAAAGFAFAGTVATLHNSWDGRLAKISKDCEEINFLCGDAAKLHVENDIEVGDGTRR